MEEDGDLPSKKRKRPPVPRQSPTTRTPLVTLSGHNQPVTAVVWPNNKEDGVITAGWDHCIRLWDLTSGVNTATLVRWRLHCMLQYSCVSTKISMFTVTISVHLRVERVTSIILESNFYAIRSMYENTSLLLEQHNSRINTYRYTSRELHSQTFWRVHWLLACSPEQGYLWPSTCNLWF